MIQTSHPVYDHNCSFCLFLGAKKVSNIIYDFYFCPKDKSNIARFGSEDIDYVSLPIFLEKTLSRFEPYKTCLELLDSKNSESNKL
jgi:hypothetical protein